MLSLTDATLSVAGNDLLVGAEWTVHRAQKVGLVGRNGSGKSTLMRLLAGELHLDHGRVERPPGMTLGYLHQHLRVDGERTTWQEAESGMTRLLALRAQYAAAETAARAGRPGAAEALGSLTEEMRLEGGFSMEERIGEVLHGLGFSPDDWHRPVAELSGGWQVRVALARMLLGEPDLLLLDEPTNHLDVLARGWLAQFLGRYPGAVVMVSHDRHLLDTACTRVTEIRGRKLHHFSGGFSDWRRQRTEAMAQLQSAYDTQQEEIARLERFVERFRYKPTKAAQAMSRQKQLDRIERLSPPERDREARLRLTEAPAESAEAFILEDATLGYGDTPVLTGVNLRLEAETRLAVLGLNGAGKSTLLATLAGTLPLLAGRRRTGRGLRVGRLTQDLARDLDPEATPVEVVRDHAPGATDSVVRGALGACGLSGEAALRPCGTLSGGEKARVVLASFAARPVNTLLLDEPTNHLDVGTVDVLIDALRDFGGAMLVVSHDRYLVEQVATHVAVVRDGQVWVREGVRPSDFELEPPTSDAPDTSEGAVAWEARKAAKRERDRLRRRAVELEGEVEAAEAAVEQIDADLVAAGADAGKLAALGKARHDAAQRVEALVEEWATVEEALASDGDAPDEAR